MKFPIVFALAFSVLLLPLAAQEATPKPARKTLTFPADGSSPDGPKASPAATPKSSAAAKSESAAKGGAKAPPKPAERAAALAKDAEKAAEADAVKKPEMPDKSASPAVVTSTVPPEPSQIARAFFGLLAKGDVDLAYEGLMKGSSIAERPDEVKSLKTKTRQAIDLFGTIHGYDLVELKPVGERLMRTTYLSLGHQYPLRWRFYFYKAEADWRLIDIRVDDKLNGIFDEAIDDAPRPGETRP